MKNRARREFIKKSILGIAGASMVPSLGITKSTDVKTIRQGQLRYRTLGKTGLQVPMLSVGTGNINNPNLVKLAYNEGLRLFFSATYYGEGNNEKMLGEAVRGFPRADLLIGTAAVPKGVDHRNGLYTNDSTYEAQIKTAEKSLQSFGLDYVDILLLPYAAKRESVFFEPLLKAMEDLKKQGKARFIGIATHSSSAEALRAAADTGVYDVAMAAYNFRVDNKQEMDDAIAYAAGKGLGIIAMKTQAGGYWDRERKQPINGGAALKWVLQNERLSTVVSGMTTVEQLQQNLAMLKDLKLTDQEKKDLKLIGDAGSPGLYCQQCSKCLSQCPYNIDIPSVMRSYMYAYGYHETRHARYLLDRIDLPDKPCNECSHCQVTCTNHFDIRSKVMDIARLRDIPMEFLQGYTGL